ncbi:hypothetical protein F4802DRAFT_598078 [Xylaria palmicola]|nr:hypothetical protein F4802DRAFT_598078 [Xylaria palmicola]
MAPSPVPRTHQVIPGAYVNIVLKADQPTGRQVRGTVQHVLTRGDHHRGIKVRLTDGRVGRVQSMAADPEGVPATQSSLSSTFSGSADPSTASASVLENANAKEPRGRGPRPRYRDARLEEPLDAAPAQIDLGAYIVPSRRKGNAQKRRNAGQADEFGDGPNNSDHKATGDANAPVATCPVCGVFEGDETAVAHHVAEHFES